ncbi:MAG: single-stranded-DNA-specific exonuclease RecJ, partial [Cytophagaceae bacterium]
MDKRWLIKKAPLTEEIEKLSSAINTNSFLSGLLLQRGIADYSSAKNFFRPQLEQLHDPFLMKDMDLAVSRIIQAMDSEEKIMVYGDYDVDGTTSVSMFYDFLRKIYPNCCYYIPDRYKEGYGISYKGIDVASEDGCGLIISLDCGIKSLEHIEYAKERNVDFIICDHHQPGETLPEASAVLDPKRQDCSYPYKELSGCGVGFKFLQALCIAKKIDTTLLFNYLDLVAVSIASDIVPITGENRVMAFYGLKVLNESPRTGLKALINIAGLCDRTIEITNVVFGLGPRINAAGRIAHAKAAVELLLCEDEEEALRFAKEIDQNNTLRKDFDSSITDEALSLIESDEFLLQAKSTVLYKEDWHKGVIGIVASRCIEKYHRPTIIMTRSGDYFAGSARSVTGFDVYEAIEKCSDLLIQFGGHKFAAGLTIKPNNLEAFQKRFEEVVAEVITPEQLIPHIEVDLEIDLSVINTKFHDILDQMKPFGPGNMQPVFVSRNVSDSGRARLLKDQHIK